MGPGASVQCSPGPGAKGEKGPAPSLLEPPFSCTWQRGEERELTAPVSTMPGTCPSHCISSLERCFKEGSRRIHPKLLPTSKLPSSSQVLLALPFKYIQSLTPLPTCTPPPHPAWESHHHSPRPQRWTLLSLPYPCVSAVNCESKCGISQPRTLSWLLRYYDLTQPGGIK